MERHTIALLALVTVIAVAFPVLYQARAHSQMVVVYQYVVAMPNVVVEEPEIIAYRDISPEPIGESEVDTVDSIKTQQEAVQKFEGVQEVQKVAEVPKQTKKKVVSTDFAQELRSEIQTRTNTIRAAKGLTMLVYDSELAQIAQGHSRDMFDRDYLSHVSPDGCDLTCRFKREAYHANYWGENIIWIEATTLPDVQKMADSFMESWMNSGGHRDNIVSANYTHAGIGVMKGEDAVYVTVNFADPK